MSGSSLPAVSNGLSNNIEAITIPLGFYIFGRCDKRGFYGDYEGHSILHQMIHISIKIKTILPRKPNIPSLRNTT